MEVEPGLDAEAGGRVSAGRFLLLPLFGALFVLLFALVASQGNQVPEVPAGAVAVVTGVPPGIGTISRAELEQEMRQRAAVGGRGGVPGPADEDYEQIRDEALLGLITDVWLRGEGEAMGIFVSDAEARRELARRGEEGTLEKAGYTPATMRERIRIELVSDRIEETLREQAAEPSAAEVEAFYEAEKEARFTRPERRDLRFVFTRDEDGANAARGELEADSSTAGWQRVAEARSLDLGTKYEGGRRAAIEEGELLLALRSPVFGAARGELIGPVAAGGGYFVLEVEALHPARTKRLDAVRAEIEQTLAGRKEQEVFLDSDVDFYERWHPRTQCASGFAVSDCANFGRFEHPSEAPPECYEADPAEPPEACPAPVPQARPALPGTVSELEPEGERLPQRPYPQPTAPPPVEEPPPASVVEAVGAG